MRDPLFHMVTRPWTSPEVRWSHDFLLGSAEEVADTGTFVARLAFNISSVNEPFMILCAMPTRMIGPPSVISTGPQSGYALQPRVAASATLGRKWFEPSTARRLRRISLDEEMAQPPCGWIFICIHDPRVAEAATLGWRTQRRCG